MHSNAQLYTYFVKLLRALDASHNLLQRLPENIFNLRELERVTVSYNQLEELPKGIGNAVMLKYLFCIYNPFKRLPKDFCELIINDNRLTTREVSINFDCDTPNIDRLVEQYKIEKNM